MRSLLLAITLLALLALPAPAYADISPPIQPPGVNPQPEDDSTQVRMLSENVLLDVLAGSTTDSLGRARVTADFTMRNLGDRAESMAVRFPISANDGWSNYPEIKDLKIQVDGKTVPHRRVQAPDPAYGDDMVPWAEFDATFPPGEDVDIRVAYWLEGSGEYPFVSFRYILSTGAGWKDTIGKADLIVRLPYEANLYNVILDYPIGWSQTSPGADLQGPDIRWHYENLEPSREDNLDVSLVMPATWQKVLDEQARIAGNPEDGEAWGRLGKLYKEMAFLRKEVRGDRGGPELYDMSIEAYERCISLLPEDALWHAGFAELLFTHYSLTQWLNPTDRSDLLRALDLLQRAMEIDPQTPKALELLEEISYYEPDYIQRNGDQFIFLYLTATPPPPTKSPSQTPLPSATPSATLPPTAPAQPSPIAPPALAEDTATTPPATATAIPDMASPSPIAAPGSKGGLCASAYLLPLLVFLPFSLHRRVLRKHP